MRLLKTACVSLLPVFAWTQGLLPCHPETQALTVTSTNDTATLASLLNCSNGSFAVQWFGDVVVSQTIYVTQGTSLNITGASTGATADGNHTTQLVSVDAASSLHITDMALVNGAAEYGGALLASDKAHVSFSGNMKFASNTAWHGGAIFAGSSSTVFWDSGETTFSNNYALQHGGAILAADSSDISWDGVTAFVNNSAEHGGGVICVLALSKTSWSSNTTFVNNTGDYGGAIFASSSSVVWGDEVTTFSNNYASSAGGALMADDASAISWGGNTTFVNNKAIDVGGAVLARGYSKVSWKGDTVFTNNEVDHMGGGVWIYFNSSVVWTGNTTFQNNSADLCGGLGIDQYSVGAWSGTTTFIHNTGASFGGGLLVYRFSNVSWSGTTTFMNNIARTAGAMFVRQADVSWTGNTVFADNIAKQDGGAVCLSLTFHLICHGTTTFRNNTALTQNGGAVAIYGYGVFGDASGEDPPVNIFGDTTFTNNSAFVNGGAVFSSGNPRGQYYEGVVFRSNSARIGGAVATFGTGMGNEDEHFPTIFVGCQFVSNTAIETGGAANTVFGREEFVSTRFESNIADVGGALNLGGVTTIIECSFVSNMAMNRGLAVAAVAIVEINGSSFHDNAFFCDKGLYMEETLKVSSRTARYGSVCHECPPWNECHECTISNSSYDDMCSIALDHTTSAAPGTTLATLSVDSGYWRATTESSTILACYNTDACLGGQTGKGSFCDNGYMGPYCSVCQRGYSSSLSATCTRCSPSRHRLFVAITVVAGIVAICAMVTFSGYLVSTNVEERESASMYHRMLRKAPLQASKSVIVVWQILTQFASVANVTYPGVYQTFLSTLDIINLDIGFGMSAGCLWSDIDFHDRLIANTILPLTILGIMGMTYAIALRRNSTADAGALEKIRSKHLSSVLFLLFLVYSSVSSTVFRMFACDSLDDGQEYLRADYRILCTDAKHRALQVYAAIMIAVYPVGIPLLFVVLLYRHRIVLSDSWADKATAQSITGLWAPYRPSCFYYEVVECGRRIMLTGVVVFIYPNATAQIAITIVNSFFFFVVSEALSPYKSVSDTWLSRFGHVLIFFSMFDVLLLKVDASQESSESQHILAGVLVAGHVVMIVAVVAEAIVLCYASRQTGREVVDGPNPFLSALRVRSVNSSRP